MREAPGDASRTGPYRGILPFRYADRDLFFGREEEVTGLTAKILLYRLVVLFGDSGSGKSSLLNAGIFPALQKEGLQPERLRVRPFEDEPILVERVQCDAEGSLPTVFGGGGGDTPSLEKTPVSLERFREILESGRGSTQPVLVFDQFEELFTLFEPAHRALQAAVLESIYAVINNPKSTAKVVLGIREDFLGKLEMLARRYPAVFDRRVRLGSLSREAARAAITGAFGPGHAFSSQLTHELAEAILADFLSGEEESGIQSTQLQIICSRLWEEFAGIRKEIGVREFESLGRIGGILGSFLEAEMSKLPLTGQRQAYAVLDHLVTRSGTRDIVGEERLKELLREHGELDEKALAANLDYLEQHRLINRTPQKGTLYFEVASEYLIAPIVSYSQKQRRVRELERQVIDPGSFVEEKLEDGIALCLSGGGYRGILFHLGGTWRLNELGYLPRIDRICGVSCGAALGAWLGLCWNRLQFDSNGVARNFREVIVEPIHRLAATTIDTFALLNSLLLPGKGEGQLTGSLSRTLFGEYTLQDLPDRPTVIIGATSLQSEALWQFSKQYMGDYHVGLARNPAVPLATAVAASLAMPPFFCVELMLEGTKFDAGLSSDLSKPPYTTRVLLVDGAIYDPLAIESAWKRYANLLVSDAMSHRLAVEQPKRDWITLIGRTLELLSFQSQNLRRRQIEDLFHLGARKGAYWGLGSMPPALPKIVEEVASTPARLKALPMELQRKIVNVGYMACGAVMRGYLNLDKPQDNPPYEVGD